MIDIIPYINSFDEIRAVTGLSKMELPDSVLGLLVYRNSLSLLLRGTTGVYAPSETVENLEEIFTRPLETDDPLYQAIQVYAVYAVADMVMISSNLSAMKTVSDGKSTMTRFSSEGTYTGARDSIKQRLDMAKEDILGLLSITVVSGVPTLVAVSNPGVDLITGV